MATAAKARIEVTGDYAPEIEADMATAVKAGIEVTGDYAPETELKRNWR